ncbi:MAG: 7TM domain-containing protein [Candidatus Gracilibacteria bacterium]
MKKIILSILFIISMANVGYAAVENEPQLIENADIKQTEVSYLKPFIRAEEASQFGKNIILDASQSFIPEKDQGARYKWDFGDGNKNEGIEVLHTYAKPGKYTVTLEINTKNESANTTFEIFAYRKAIALITDQTDVEERIEIIKNFAEKQEVYIKIIESFGSSTEFISEEILAKKINENNDFIQKTDQIATWTKENAGLNALNRYYLDSSKKGELNFGNKTILDIEENVQANQTRIKGQYKTLSPKRIIVANEASIYALIQSENDEDFIKKMDDGGYEYKLIDSKTSSIRPWNFMSYFVNILINQGVPDNTIALLLLLPVIATVVTFMKQFVGITTFGIYTPTIMTLSFLIIGLPAGLMTLLSAISIGALSRPILKKTRMLFIPKMAVLLTIVSLLLFLILILSVYLNFFNAAFLSIAIFPMLILSTLVEQFISVKTEKGFSSAALLMGETIFVAIIAYILVGGEINLVLFSFKFNFIKNLMISYPETIFLILIINILLGKWTGLRLLERIRFREVLRHIEE